MFAHTLRQKSGGCLPSVSSRRITWLSAARPSEPGSRFDLAGAIEKDSRILVGQWLWVHLWPTKIEENSDISQGLRAGGWVKAMVFFSSGIYSDPLSYVLFGRLTQPTPWLQQVHGIIVMVAGSPIIGKFVRRLKVLPWTVLVSLHDVCWRKKLRPQIAFLSIQQLSDSDLHELLLYNSAHVSALYINSFPETLRQTTIWTLLLARK